MISHHVIDDINKLVKRLDDENEFAIIRQNERYVSVKEIDLHDTKHCIILLLSTLEGQQKTIDRYAGAIDQHCIEIAQLKDDKSKVLEKLQSITTIIAS